jgi:putative lipoprotein
MKRPRAAALAALLACVGGGARRVHAQRANDEWLGADKALHASASASVALLGYGGAALVTDDRGMRAGVATAIAIDVGIAKELWDLAGHGDPSRRDLAWDVVGTAAGVAIAAAIDWIFHRVGGVRRAGR